MAIFGLSSRTVALIGFGLFLAFYLDESPLTISTDLSNWITKGSYMNYRGYKIFYREEKGREDLGETVVCLHGFPTFSFDWSKVWKELRTKFKKVVALDFLGYGYSDKPPRHSYSVMEQADIVEALLDQLGIYEAHILAHDYGDTVAQELLARFADREQKGQKGLYILSVALLNGGIFPETHFATLGQKLLLLPYLNQLLVKLMNIYTFQRSLNEVFGADGKLHADEAGDFYAALINNNGHIVMPKLLAYIEERKHNRARWVGILKSTSVPVHCIYGPADPVNPVPEFPDAFKNLVSEDQLTILSDYIGHYPQWEAPQQTVLAYFQFIRHTNKQLFEDTENGLDGE